MPFGPDPVGADPVRPDPVGQFAAGRYPVGLCSVTFRALDAARVIRLASAAAVDCIEWAGDTHVPAGDIVTARRIGQATRDAALAVSSYGSYYDGRGDVADALASCAALEAPRMRVWAGDIGSGECSPDRRAAIVARLRDAARHAADLGITLALEYHGRTLTDTPQSALQLVDELAGEVSLYWQPPVGMPDVEALDGLRMVLPHVTAVHAFSWWPTHEQRHPLAYREDLWREALSVISATAVVPFIEFLPGDDPALLAGEVHTLRALATP